MLIGRGKDAEWPERQNKESAELLWSVFPVIWTWPTQITSQKCRRQMDA